MTAKALDESFLAVRAGAKRGEGDLHLLYAEMQRTAPLWRSPWGDVYLSSFDLVDQALASRAMSHALQPGRARESGGSPIADWLMFMDGREHALMRRAFQGPFVGGDGSLVRRVAAIVDEQMNAVELDCPIDAVAQFTRAIPEKVIGGMLGLPRQDLPMLRAWSAEIRTALDTGMESIAAGKADAAADLTTYFADVLSRKSPGNATVGDFNVGDLVDALGMRTAASNLAFIAFAGYETTVHLLGSMLWHLSNRPDVWNALRQTPELATVVVSEALRLESPVQKVCRWALNDIELAGGYRLHKGEYAVLLLGAANRDPARFAMPDTINLSQAQTVHVGFGKGLHACLGRGLAMIEGVAVLRWLIAHVRTIPPTGCDPEWIPNSSFRGLQRLPITLCR
jgi:cytochrome P450